MKTKNLVNQSKLDIFAKKIETFCVGEKVQYTFYMSIYNCIKIKVKNLHSGLEPLVVCKSLRSNNFYRFF